MTLLFLILQQRAWGQKYPATGVAFLAQMEQRVWDVEEYNVILL